MDYLERVAADAGLRFALGRLVGAGQRPTVFFGAPSVTVHRHDAAGRVVRSETEGWSEEDREWLWALAAYEARLCSNGHDLAVSGLAANEGRFRTQVAGVCHQCVTEKIVMDEKATSHPHPEALLYSTTLPPKPEAS